MKVEIKKEPLKAAIVCHGGRVTLTAANIRSVEFEYLREYLLHILGRTEVDFVSKKTKKEEHLPHYKDIFTTDLNDYDEVYIYNASYNLFGGVVPAESIELMKKLYDFKGNLWYYLGDPKMPYKDYAKFLKSRLKDGKLKTSNDPEFTDFTEEWLDSWSEKVFPRVHIAYPGKDYNLYYTRYMDNINKRNSKNKDQNTINPNYKWFFLDLYGYFAVNEKLDLKLKDYDFKNKEYDLVYFGNDRMNERNRIIKNLYNNVNLKKFFIGFDPEMENCTIEKYVHHDELFNLIGEKCYATVVVGDYLHTSDFKTARFYEAMLLDTVAFISTTYDPEKEFITNDFLRDFVYVSNSDELYEKIQMIKNDESLYKKIVRLEREEILNSTKQYIK